MFIKGKPENIKHKEIDDTDFYKLLKDTILVSPIQSPEEVVLAIEEQNYKYIYDSLKSGSKLSVDTMLFDKYMSYVVLNIMDYKFVLAIEENMDAITKMMQLRKFSICLNEEEFNRKGGRRKYNRWFKLSTKDVQTISISILILADRNKRRKESTNEEQKTDVV